MAVIEYVVHLLDGHGLPALIIAQAIAAEQWAFGDTWIDQYSEAHLDAISEITPRLINSPIWGFWWD